MTPPEDRRKPGRPRVDEKGQVLATYVRTSDYDRIVRLAMKTDRTVSALVRDLLKLKLR